MTDLVRVFIGSGEASVLACHTLVQSLRQNTRRPLDLWIFNGTHNAVEHNDEPPVLAPLSLRLKYRQKTEFSLYRYLIPEICGHRGRAIYLDSDTVCLGDIGELFDTPLHGRDFLAKADGYGPGSWASSVMLIDCERTCFDLERIFDDIDQGVYKAGDFSRLSRAFCDRHTCRVGELDPRWNEFDQRATETKLVHYTNLMTQPWKYPGHPAGDLWFDYFYQALASGTLTARDIDTSIERGYARPDILAGNRPRWRRVRRLAGMMLRPLIRRRTT